MNHPFRFGAHLRHPIEGLTWAETAQRIESLGFSTLNMPDHFDDQLAATPALAAAAAATDTLHIGALVYCNDYRHPMLLAQEMATLDLLSEGRLELGLGAGWMRSDYEASGMAYDRPGVRIDRMVEALDVIYGLFAEGPFSYTGDHYTIRNHEGLPKPHQPKPPLLIGGGGPRMLGIAARRADIVGVNPNLRSGAIDAETMNDVSAEKFDAKIGWVRDAAGERFDQIELNVGVQSIQLTSDSKATKETLDVFAAFFERPPEEIAETPMLLIGSPTEIADILRQRRERWGFSYISVGSDTDFEAFADIINELSGE